MVQLVLTEEQRRLLNEATGDVSLVDSQGRIVAIAAPVFTAVEIAEASHCQATEPQRFTLQEVITRVRAQDAT